MPRATTIRNLYDKVFNFMPLDGIWKEALGRQTRSGLWIIYGHEKNGKSAFALMLADSLSAFERVLYVSAEEGMEDTFVDTCRKACISYDNRSLHFLEYTPIDDLLERLRKHKSERIIFIDNLFVYRREISEDVLIRMKREFSDTLFVFVAHEKDGYPYPGNAESCQKLAKIIFRVQGMAVEVGGRGGANGTFVIDGTNASLYHGSHMLNQKKIKEQ